MITAYVDGFFSPKRTVHCYKNFLQETLLDNQPSDQVPGNLMSYELNVY